MNLNIYNYLHNFEEMNLTNENGVVVEDNDRVVKLNDLKGKYNKNYYYSVDDNFYLYVKRLVDSRGKVSGRLISELLTTKVYEDNNINCIKTFPFKMMDDDTVCSASEDLSQLEGIASISNENPLDDDYLYNYYNRNKSGNLTFNDLASNEWLIVTNQFVKNYLLTFLTQEAYDQLVDLLIVDTLFYNWDRFGNGKNLFFASTTRGSKYEGVIPIDLESINFDHLKTHYNNSVNKFVKDLYEDVIVFTMPHGYGNAITYKKRIANLKKVMDEGYFNPNQVALIKSVLNTNIASTIEEILNKYNMDFGKKVINVYKDIWNRNGEMLKI